MQINWYIHMKCEHFFLSKLELYRGVYYSTKYYTIHFSIYSGSHNNEESSGTLQQRPRKMEMIPKIQCHALRRLTLSRLSVTVLLIDSMISREWYAYNSNYHWCTSKATTDFCYQHEYFPPKMLTKTAKYNNLVFWSMFVWATILDWN